MEKHPSEKRRGVVVETEKTLKQIESFKGPLPPPALYKAYDEILPGTAERILDMVMNEQNHRQNWENRVLDAQKSDVHRGHWMGFGLGIGGLAVVAFCAWIGYPILAAGSILIVIFGIIAAIFNRK